MPRNRSAPPPPPDLYAWLAAFVDELQRLRPHVSLRLGNTIGRAEYAPDADPRATAQAYHSRQTPAPTTRPTKRNR